MRRETIPSTPAERIAGGIDVPPGFVVTAETYLEALDRANLRATLLDRARTLTGMDPAALSAERAGVMFTADRSE